MVAKILMRDVIYEYGHVNPCADRGLCLEDVLHVECCVVGSRKAASNIMVAQIKPQTKASKTDDYWIALVMIDMSDHHKYQVTTCCCKSCMTENVPVLSVSRSG